MIPLWEEYIKAARHEVLPAIGCTEPVSLALAAAIAASYVKPEPVIKIKARVSPNLMKNGMGVTVPGTGMTGLFIAAAAGVSGGDPQAGLEVLKGLNPETVSQARKLTEHVSVDVADVNSEIYSEAVIFTENHQVKVCIQGGHTDVFYIEKDGNVIFQKSPINNNVNQDYSFQNASLQSVITFAEQVAYSDIEFILQSAEINDALSREGLRHDYGLHIGTTLMKSANQKLVADDLMTRIIIRTASASDARMGGAMLPAMSNSGSGNQGIAATMPVVVVADFLTSSREDLARALILSHVIAIYIHSKFPLLSALCAATTAAMGAAAGMAWLLDNNRGHEIIPVVIGNMIGDLSGMICDGASNSCAMKVSSAVTSAFRSVLMALDNSRITGNEGIVCDDIESSINNLCSLASNSMKDTDRQIIEIMTHKTGSSC